MITPTAPALCALPTLVEKAQLPRRTSAIAPLSAPARSEEQASPSLPSCETSRTGAASGGLGLGPSPNSALMRWPAASTAAEKTCELVEDPTRIAHGPGPR